MVITAWRSNDPNMIRVRRSNGTKMVMAWILTLMALKQDEYVRLRWKSTTINITDVNKWIKTTSASAKTDLQAWQMTWCTSVTVTSVSLSRENACPGGVRSRDIGLRGVAPSGLRLKTRAKDSHPASSRSPLLAPAPAMYLRPIRCAGMLPYSRGRRTPTIPLTQARAGLVTVDVPTLQRQGSVPKVKHLEQNSRNNFLRFTKPFTVSFISLQLSAFDINWKTKINYATTHLLDPCSCWTLIYPQC